MQAKIINKAEIGFVDIIKGNFLVHRLLSGFYVILFVLSLAYLASNYQALLYSLSALILGLVLLLLTAWVGFIWPIARAVIWLIKLQRSKHTKTQKLTISFFDLYLKVDNDTLNSQYKLEYKDVNKVIETKSLLLIIFGYNNFIIVKKDCFAKENDLDKLKGYLARFKLVVKKKK